LKTATWTEIILKTADSKEIISHLSDEELMVRIAGGDEAAFSELCGRFLKWAYHFDMRILQSDPDAQDAVQEKFLQIWRKAHQFEVRDGSRVSNYILKIDKNICLDALSRSWRQHEIIPDPGSPDDHLGMHEVLDYLEYCHRQAEAPRELPCSHGESRDLLEKIYAYTEEAFSGHQFTCFWGFVTGMSYKEISATYALETGSVRGYIARGFKQIRDRFAAEMTAR
jgi:RNA polymerase sigma factor (sigma-70 family)